jgi:uncharacterized protein (TIGR02594 family)
MAIEGPHTNAVIEQFYKDAGHAEIKGDDVPWCSAFVGAILHECGLPISGSLLARSWLDIGTDTTTPQLGDLVIFWRVTKDSIFGHVGFYVSEDNGMIYVLGGNQKNQVCISPFSKTQVLGYRQLVIQA